MEILGGPLFAVAGAGESHGPAITTIVMGCPPGLYLERARLQACLDRRRPGSSRHGTPRREDDRVHLVGGLFQEGALYAEPSLSLDGAAGLATYDAGFTTGEPLAALVFSRSRQSAHYDQFKGPSGEVRPGHTDLVKHYKSRGFADYRGGGRSSYRSTISDVIGGSVARAYLADRFDTHVFSSICQIGPLRARASLHAQAQASPPAALAQRLAASELHTLDPDFAAAAAALIKETRIQGDSLGAAIEVVAVNPPPLAGEPLYQSLKLRIMGALGGLHAVYACEMGAGKAAVARTGSQNNDPIRADGYRTNNHGGLLGGITTGSPLAFTVSFKPTASIVKPQASVTKDFREIDFRLRRGRHDPCVGVRAGVTLESRLAIELMNAALMHQARQVHPDDFRLFPTG